MFKTPAKKKREALLDKVLAPLSPADQEAIRKAFISGISRDDLVMLAKEAGLVQAFTTLTGRIGIFSNGVDVFSENNIVTAEQSASVRYRDAAAPLLFSDTMARSPTITVAAGAAIRNLSNNVTDAIVKNGDYSLDTSGLKKTSVNANSILFFEDGPADIDIEIGLGSLFNAADSNNGIWLFYQDATHYCYVSVANNTNTSAATLAIKENAGAGELTLASVGGIYGNAVNTKFTNTNPTMRVVVRNGLANVAINGVVLLRNVRLNNTWGRHGIRHWAQNSYLKNIVRRAPIAEPAPSVRVLTKKPLYGDGIKYTGWAHPQPLNDGTCAVVWRESPLTTAQGGHQQGGCIKISRWKDGKFVGSPVELYSAAGNGVADAQEQDCILSRVVYNGADHLVLFTRVSTKTPSTNQTYVSICNISTSDPTNPASWSARVQVSFDSQIAQTAGHSSVIPSADGSGFLCAFYGPRVGDMTKGGVVLASSSDLVTWTFKSFVVDSLAVSNPVPGGDYEPALIRVGGSASRSLMVVCRARTIVSPNDGETWNQYDASGSRGGANCHFASAIQAPHGAALMFRNYKGASVAAPHVIMPLRTYDGVSYAASDWSTALEVDVQEFGMNKPGLANPGGDGGCLRAASLGGGRYLVTNYKQDVDEAAPRLWQYIIDFSA